MPSMQNPARADYHPKKSKIKGTVVPPRKGTSATASRAPYAGTPDRSVVSNDDSYSTAISRLQPRQGKNPRSGPVARNVDIRARKLGDPDLPAADQGMTQGRVPRGTQSGSQNPGGDHLAQHRPKSGSRVPTNTTVPKNRSTNAPRLDSDEQLLLSPEHERAMARFGEGGQPRGQTAGHGLRHRTTEASPDLIDQIVKAHLASVGQRAGTATPAENRVDPSAVPLTSLQGGPAPAGGMHMPGGMAGPSGGGQPGAAGAAVAGQNPLAPFLAQVLNPRMSAAGGQGAVPTLPGSPQGFSLYNMLRLISMFKQLYGMLPVEGSAHGLPTGIPGPGY